MKKEVFRQLSIMLLLMFGVLMTPSFVSAGVISQPVNSLGLIGYWSFEDNQDTTSVDDYSGNGNTGTMTNMDATPANDYVDGYKSSSTAMDFDGGDDTVVVGASTDFQVTDLTISLWVKSSAVYGGEKILIEHSVYPASDMYQITSMDDDTLRFNFAAMNGGDGPLDYNVDFTDGAWHHVVATFSDSGNLASIYFDGVLATSKTVGQSIGTGSSSTYIASRGNSSLHFEGSIDNTRLYSRSLSAAEVHNLYTKSATVKTSNNTNLIGYWSFEDATGTKATDFSVNNNEGTLTNMTLGTEWVNGRVGKALDFDGSDDYVAMDTMTIPIESTVSAWIYVDSIGSDQTIFGTCEDPDSACLGGNYQQSTLHIGPTGKLSYGRSHYDGGGSHYYEETNSALSTGEWIHVAATFTDSGVNEDVTLFVNGVSVSATVTNDSNPPSFTYSSKPSIGSLYTSFGPQYLYPFSGKIDDVRFYDSALTASQIQDVYDSAKHTKLNTTQNHKLTDGLIGHWSFNGPNVRGTLAEDTAGGNHGTLTNGPVLAQGKVGQGLSFDGGDDYIDISAAPITDFDSFSVAAWIKPDATHADVYPRIFDQMTFPGNTNRVQFYLYDSGFNLGVFVEGLNGGVDLDSGVTVVAGEWQHVVFTCDGSNYRFYLDGSLANTSAVTGSVSSGGNNSSIGNRTGNIDGHWSGGLDEVRVYSKVLSDKEVQRLYNLGK